MILKLNELLTKSCTFILILVPSAIAIWNKYLMINSDSWRFTNVFRHEQKIQNIECLVLCDQTVGCETVNYNSKAKSCELLYPGLWVPTAPLATESSWVVYYKGAKHIIAASVWQTSTRVPTNAHSADLAVDGNRNNTFVDRCAHTDDYLSSWTIEFEHEAEVSHAVVYLWNDKQYNHRNTNLTLVISETRQDSDNNIGTVCATYTGPPASPLPPVKITCTQPVTGRFLKINHNYYHHLALCEVEVFST
ncbi:uncharacterized protein LOC132750125 [Ruditapes philippinarum]|uniref:uncharacterized protein LOC132750125 n=1 Tax=Ruditapes philippinarum TaxID=129788 RepID=UPI00295B19DF|nr:uncharacterized protein LOC132750125 [Ruditapes philippinarum]